MNIQRSFLIALGGTVLSIIPLSAVTLAQWDFHSLPADTSGGTAVIEASPISVSSSDNTSLIVQGLSVSNITSPYLQRYGNAYAGDLNVKPNTTSASWESKDNLSAALTSGKYFTFDISVASGYTGTFSLESLGTQYWRNGGGAADNLSIWYTTNPMASAVSDYLQLGSTFYTNLVPTTAGTRDAGAVNTPTFSGIVSNTGYLKIIVLPTYDSTTKNGNLHFEGITVNGTANVLPVPEPSTYAMLAGATALGLIILRRRKK